MAKSYEIDTTLRVKKWLYSTIDKKNPVNNTCFHHRALESSLWQLCFTLLPSGYWHPLYDRDKEGEGWWQKLADLNQPRETQHMADLAQMNNLEGNLFPACSLFPFCIFLDYSCICFFFGSILWF